MAACEETELNRQEVARPRLQWIDALRALAIVLVIFGHQAKGMTPYFVFTSPVKIPLFFMISGFVFNEKRKRISDLLAKLGRTIVVPWFALTLPPAFLRAATKPDFELLHYVFELVSGQRMWYIPCCIVAEIIWFYCLKAAKGKRGEVKLLSLSLATFAAGLVVSTFDVLSFAMINRALVAQLFLYMGHTFKRHHEVFDRVPLATMLLLIAAYILLGEITMVYWPGRSLDIHMNEYYSLPICYAMIVLGCFALFTIASKGGEYPPIICFIGKNTLVFYLLHAINLSVVHKVASAFGISIASPLGLAFVDTALACLACGVEAFVINNYLPFLVGRKRG